jgi:hypothetical protein
LFAGVVVTDDKFIASVVTGNSCSPVSTETGNKFIANVNDGDHLKSMTPVNSISPFAVYTSDKHPFGTAPIEY